MNLKFMISFWNTGICYEAGLNETSEIFWTGPNSSGLDLQEKEYYKMELVVCLLTTLLYITF